MKKDIQKLTTRGQTLIDLACSGGALLISIILILLGCFITKVFFYILIAYHVVGGLLNCDLASGIISAIIFAPYHIGGKIALYIQHIIVEDNLKNLTKDDLRNINQAIIEVLNRHPNQKKKVMRPILYGCDTYGELQTFNDEIIVPEYNKRKE